MTWEGPKRWGTCMGLLVPRRVSSRSDMRFLSVQTVLLVDCGKALAAWPARRTHFRVHFTADLEAPARRGEPSSRAWRFIYCENMPVELSRLRRGDFVFSFNHLGSRMSGSKSFTLNSVTADEDPSLRIRLCFSY